MLQGSQNNKNSSRMLIVWGFGCLFYSSCFVLIDDLPDDQIYVIILLLIFIIIYL